MRAALCPTCHRPMPRPRSFTVPTNASSTAEVYAYYKATAPLEDLRFALRAGVEMSPELADDWQDAVYQAEAGLPDAQCRTLLADLLDRWGAERRAVHRAAWNRRQVRMDAFFDAPAKEAKRA